MLLTIVLVLLFIKDILFIYIFNIKLNNNKNKNGEHF